MKEQSQIYQRRGKLFLGTAAAVLLSVVLFVYLLDPFMNYRVREDMAYPYTSTYQPTWAMGRSSHITGKNAVWVGSSLSTHINEGYVDERFGVKTMKVCFSAGRPNVYKLALENAFKNNEIEYVFYESFFQFWFLYSLQGTDYNLSRIEKYMLSNDPAYEIEYLLNRDVVVEALKMIEKNLPGDDSAANAEGADPRYGLKQMAEKTDGVLPADTDFEECLRIGLENVENNIVPLLTQYPDKKFIFFVPPVSVCWLVDARDSGYLDMYLKCYEEIFRKLLEYDNAEVYAINTNWEYCTNLDNYMDRNHYSKEGGKMVVDCLAENRYQVTETNLEDFMDSYRTAARDFKMPFLRETFQNEDVWKLQEELAARGYAAVPTGIWDKTTTEAVEEFQKDHGIEVTGIAFEDTLKLLGVYD